MSMLNASACEMSVNYRHLLVVYLTTTSQCDDMINAETPAST